MGKRLVVGVVVAWLVFAAPALAADRVVERGIVQSAGPSSLVLRALDGVEVSVPVGPQTRVRLNGLPATLAEITPGLVAETVQNGPGPAVRVLAFGRAPRVVERGSVVRVARGAMVLRLTGAGRVRIPLTERTLVRRAGRLVALRALRKGTHVVVQRAADGSARVVRVARSA